MYREAAAVQCFRRLASFPDDTSFRQYRQNLQSALGRHYQARHELVLPFANQSDLNHIEILAEGRYGRVFSAVWDRPPKLPGGRTEVTPVVLKHIQTRGTRGEEDAERLIGTFLDEVPLMVFTC